MANANKTSFHNIIQNINHNIFNPYPRISSLSNNFGKRVWYQMDNNKIEAKILKQQSKNELLLKLYNYNTCINRKQLIISDNIWNIFKNIN